jgi:hypothetical protein
MRVRDMLNNSIPEVDAIKTIIKKGRNTIGGFTKHITNFDLNKEKKLSMTTNMPSILDKRFATEMKGRYSRKSNNALNIGFNIAGF